MGVCGGVEPQTGGRLSGLAAAENKRYEPDSMHSQFRRDAATGFASMALLAE